MSHKTLIDGTVYEISGGKTLIGGTAYEIANGKTLVDGTVYEVGFVPDTVIVTMISGAIDTDYCCAEVYAQTPDGESIFLDSAGTYEFPIGTIITCEVTVFYSSGTHPSGSINVNNVTVASSNPDNPHAYYKYTLNHNINIEIVDNYYNGCEINITE